MEYCANDKEDRERGQQPGIAVSASEIRVHEVGESVQDRTGGGSGQRDKQTVGDHGGMIVHAGGEDFWFAGQGITVTFEGADGGPPLVGIDIAEEGIFENGKWLAGRRLNGDQTQQGRDIRLPPGKAQIQKVRFYRYR